ncbi:MAG: hypothetical protein ACREP9_04340, partial [Candidatus Dormibacteraceae bacterium]
MKLTNYCTDITGRAMGHEFYLQCLPYEFASEIPPDSSWISCSDRWIFPAAGPIRASKAARTERLALARGVGGAFPALFPETELGRGWA